MNSLFVRFPGDNDFINTVEAFVKAIAPRLLSGYGVRTKITNEQIADLFNKTAPALFLLHQAKLGSLQSQFDKGYLIISPNDVYIDGEFAEISTSNYNHDGCLAQLCHNDEIMYTIV